MNTTDRHTPGPWRLDRHTYHVGPQGGWWTVRDARNISIVAVEPFDAAISDGETAANAHLIAAAPTMADYIEYVDAKIDLDEVPLRFAQWQDAAIALAEGREEPQ